MTKNFGFTLAEVLITLGIIGVVAAMTMPTLINQTNGAQYKAAYKKALSAISQAITLNVALDDKSFADATVISTTDAPANSVAGFLKERMNVVNIDDGDSYPSGSFAGVNATYCEETEETTVGDVTGKKIKACGTGDTPTTAEINPDIVMYFNDSSVFAFKANQPVINGGCKSTSPCFGIIDVNGVKGPNKETTAATVADIYPVVFYDQTIQPASDAAKTVLYGK